MPEEKLGKVEILSDEGDPSAGVDKIGEAVRKFKDEGPGAGEDDDTGSLTAPPVIEVDQSAEPDERPPEGRFEAERAAAADEGAEGPIEEEGEEAVEEAVEGEEEEGVELLDEVAGGAEEKAEAEGITLTLPDALHSQGVTEIQVDSEEDAEIMRALTNGYMRRKDVETAKATADEFEQTLQNEFAEANALMVAAPLHYLLKTQNLAPEVLLDSIKLHLLENPSHLEELATWQDRLQTDDREAGFDLRDLTQKRDDRFREVREKQSQLFAAKKQVATIRTMVGKLVTIVPDAFRDKVQRAMLRELYEEARRRDDEGKSDMIQADEVENLVGFYVEPYKQGSGVDGKPRVAKATEETAEETRQKFSGRLERQRRGTGARAASGSLTRAGPKKGETLDQVLNRLTGRRPRPTET